MEELQALLDALEVETRTRCSNGRATPSKIATSRTSRQGLRDALEDHDWSESCDVTRTARRPQSRDNTIGLQQGSAAPSKSSKLRRSSSRRLRTVTKSYVALYEPRRTPEDRKNVVEGSATPY